MTGVAGVAVGNGGTGVGLATISGVGEGATFAGSGDLEHAETETNSAATKYFFIMLAPILGFRVFLSRDIPVSIPATYNGEVPTLVAGEKTPVAGTGPLIPSAGTACEAGSSSIYRLPRASFLPLS